VNVLNMIDRVQEMEGAHHRRSLGGNARVRWGKGCARDCGVDGRSVCVIKVTALKGEITTSPSTGGHVDAMRDEHD